MYYLFLPQHKRTWNGKKYSSFRMHNAYPFEERWILLNALLLVCFKVFQWIYQMLFWDIFLWKFGNMTEQCDTESCNEGIKRWKIICTSASRNPTSNSICPAYQRISLRSYSLLPTYWVVLMIVDQVSCIHWVSIFYWFKLDYVYK